MGGLAGKPSYRSRGRQVANDTALEHPDIGAGSGAGLPEHMHTCTIPQAAALRTHGEAYKQLGAWGTMSACDCTTAGTTTRTVPNLT